ncbi:DUF4229 domain-containing protein [Corynebacterium macginleyi]|uniref:DUF4229 domain-containing protein n=1 Tax=Corynebacterium macginleyi TaxID=38290 RepID=A0A3M0GYJ8_9CORY|nr:DUF4229 domain-containing protein [Corynebacterium macginleyi]MBK4139216.1 DUF4229 domain-containing protein [Corynebacterium macginleyi]MBK4144013.1 DUF4229 domain-containing protein [Corynebacterium macginleyi]MBK4156938.1 DUF4229 domain-containing protein [Corynebacterium macginleyi]MBK4163464.1 DUF4229 domain-containing protein [Corynebacterium macginleyi]MBK4165337.1 DUF4229 domain-containing protein [Corynebacterium macginleyi]
MMHNPEPPKPDLELRRRSRKALWKYGLARVVLFIALTVIIELLAVVIGVPIPILLAALLALFVALPLSMLIFKNWRVEATQTLAEYSAQRKAHRRWVQAELEGRAQG